MGVRGANYTMFEYHVNEKIKGTVAKEEDRSGGGGTRWHMMC